MPKKKIVSACTIVTGFMVLASSSALAVPTLTLGTGPDPTESITTQVLGSGTSASKSTELAVTLKPSGGQACGANYAADSNAGGQTVLFDESVEEGPFSNSANYTFTNAGSYLLCGWLVDRSQPGEPVVAAGSLAVTVRPPHLSLSISAPTAVTVGQTFQIVTTAQTEVQRSVTVQLVSDTGRGCPANYSASESGTGTRTIIGEWHPSGGPISESRNETLSAPGQYLICGYIEYPDSDSPPEATASAPLTVVAPPPPCVVPSSTTTTRLAAIEQAIRAGGCAVGTVRPVASRTVRAGYVISLSRPSAQHLPNSTPVNVTVSTGPPCIVPRVSAGTALGTVERRLAANHCAAGNVSSARSRRVRRGRVLRLGARTGQVLASHAPIPIVIARHRR